MPSCAPRVVRTILIVTLCHLSLLTNPCGALTAIHVKDAVGQDARAAAHGRGLIPTRKLIEQLERVVSKIEISLDRIALVFQPFVERKCVRDVFEGWNGVRPAIHDSGALRGGGDAAALLKNPTRTHEAVAFFNYERLPASFLAGASLSLMFAFPLLATDRPDVQVAKHLYVILACLSFCNNILSVFLCSTAIVRLTANKHDGNAQSAIEMMIREIPVHFCGTRAHFLSGLLCFTGALSMRLWATYNNASDALAKGMTALLGSAMMYMVALFNMSLVHFDSFGHLWLQYLASLARAIRRNGVGPCSLAALALALYSAGSLLRLLAAGIEHAIPSMPSP